MVRQRPWQSESRSRVARRVRVCPTLTTAGRRAVKPIGRRCRRLGRIDAGRRKVARLSDSSGTGFTLEGIDTSDTVAYPAGSGIGSVRKVTGWTQIQQVLTTSTSGGDQQFATFQFIEADQETRIPTTKSAAGLDLSVADDPSLPGYIAMSAANDDRNQRALKCTLSNGSIILYNAFCSVNKTPSMTANQVMACAASLSFINADPVRYAS